MPSTAARRRQWFERRGNEQTCRPATLVVVDARLSAPPFLAGPPRPDRLVASACQAALQDPSSTFVSAAHARRSDPSIDDGKKAPAPSRGHHDFPLLMAGAFDSWSSALKNPGKSTDEERLNR